MKMENWHRSLCHRGAARDIFPNDARYNGAQRRVVGCKPPGKAESMVGEDVGGADADAPDLKTFRTRQISQ